MMRELAQRVKDELDWQVFVGIEAKHLCYYKSDAPLFGATVFEGFLSANDDIDEAGKCLALCRGTASVMHLMRAAEVGLLALAKKVGVTNKNDWGSYLREITQALEVKAKAAGARTADKQFYAESAAQFEHLKRAWRNRTMHVDRSYSTERAEEIFSAVKSFLTTLATRLSELERP